jgi:protein gp37
MSEETNISWTDHTFNAWMGCDKVSAGCDNCYAEALVGGRMGYTGDRTVWGPAPHTPRHRTAASTWANVSKWNSHAETAGVRRRVFCGSLMDFFEDHPTPNAIRPEVFALIHRTPHLDWQLLTKRPQNIARFLPDDWGDGYSNVWLGCTIEANIYVGRAAQLTAVPAVCRFVSYEPAIGPLDKLPLDGIDWLIYGGESGPGFRPHNVQWARDLRARCDAAGVSFFYKQSPGRLAGRGVELDGQIVHEFPTPRIIAPVETTALA